MTASDVLPWAALVPGIGGLALSAYIARRTIAREKRQDATAGAKASAEEERIRFEERQALTAEWRALYDGQRAALKECEERSDRLEVEMQGLRLEVATLKAQVRRIDTPPGGTKRPEGLT